MPAKKVTVIVGISGNGNTIHIMFEKMDFWKDAISISDVLSDYPDNAEEKGFYKS